MREYTYYVWTKPVGLRNTPIEGCFLAMQRTTASTAKKAIKKVMDNSPNMDYYGCLSQTKYFKLCDKHCPNDGWLDGSCIKQYSAVSVTQYEEYMGIYSKNKHKCL